jgi:hypothetical protein
MAERSEFELPVPFLNSQTTALFYVCDARTNTVQNLGAPCPSQRHRRAFGVRVVRSGLFLSGRFRNRWLEHRRRRSR